MASITKRPRGNKWVQFRSDGKHHTIRLGKASLDWARIVAQHVDAILAARVLGDPIPIATARWLAGVAPELRQRFAATGLTQAAPERRPVRLESYLEYAKTRYANLTKHTQRNRDVAGRRLLECLGNVRIDAITSGDVGEFRDWLASRGLAPVTVSETLLKCRTLFSYAVDKEWLLRNPFAKLSGLVRDNPTRQHFIGRDTIDTLLSVCCPDWQLAIVLARYAGLRCPSELLRLAWDDVNWDRMSLKVHSSKTDEFRVCPIFPEVYPHLSAAWDRIDGNPEHVVTSCRDAGHRALYSGLKKRLARAGLQRWERLWQNMRSTRQTELVQQGHAMHDVCKWLGNSPKIATQHYLQTTEAAWQAAVQGPEPAPKKRSQKAKP